MAQQAQGRLVGPVEIVEEEHQRPFLARRLQQAADRLEEQELLDLRVARVRARELLDPAGEHGREALDLPAVGRHVAFEERVGRALDALREDLDPRPVGQREVLVGAAVEHVGALVVGVRRDPRAQPRLADPGLAARRARAGVSRR